MFMNGVWVKIMKFPNTPLSWTRVSPTKGHSTKTVNNAENPIQGYFQPEHTPKENREPEGVL